MTSVSQALPLRLLNNIYLEIASSEQDVSTLAEILLDRAVELVNAQGGRLCLLDNNSTGVGWIAMKNLREKPTKDVFGETDQLNLEMCTQFSLIAIKNAHLYAESHIEKCRFETIAEIIRGAAQSLKTYDIVRSSYKLLEGYGLQEQKVDVSIRLYDKEMELLRLEPDRHESFYQKIGIKRSEDVITQRRVKLKPEDKLQLLIRISNFIQDDSISSDKRRFLRLLDAARLLNLLLPKKKVQ